MSRVLIWFGLIAAVVWLVRKRTQHKRPVRIRVKVHTVPPNPRVPTPEIIETEGEVVSQRRA